MDHNLWCCPLWCKKVADVMCLSGESSGDTAISADDRKTGNVQVFLQILKHR